MALIPYTAYMKTATAITTTITDSLLHHVGRQLYENEHGHPPEQSLPDKDIEFTFEHNGFTGDILGNDPNVHNLLWNNKSLTKNRIGAKPEDFTNLINDAYTTYWDVLGDWKPMARQPDHPGKPPITQDNLQDAMETLLKHAQLLRTNPTIDDLVHAITDRNYIIAAMFFDIDPEDLFTPGQGAEISGLFTNGTINIIYQDDEIALLKPEYKHDITLEVLNQQAGPFQQVRFTGDPLEQAYVVGIDDTPTGLFGHTLDGTNLTPNQHITRTMINNAMGFHRSFNYNHNTLTPNPHEKIRLQGDLAIEHHSTTTPNNHETKQRLNLPIDNHLCMLTGNISLPPNETTDTEPIKIHIHQQSLLNILHDEHRQFAAEIPPGTYSLYLLPRGLQQPQNRPQWNPQQPTTNTLN